MSRFLALVALVLIAPLPGLAETTVPQSQPQIALSFAPVVRVAAPAVVNIYATRVVEQSASPFAGDPFFDQFFQEFGRSEPRVQNSLGSGVIVASDGIVVSNYHVVEQATEIRVVLNDRREYPARVLLADKSVDLAVLRLEGAEGLPALTLRDSDQMQVGDLVLAIGNPFGVGQTVSSGIVSGLARSAFQVSDGRGYFIQTDAPINPGNSGGALVDTGGQLVGINTAILTRSGGSNGIGFAIPSNLVAAVVAQAQAGNTRFEKPWAGVAAQAVDAAMADAMELGLPRGVVLTEIAPASPFAAAGLKAGDVVTSLAGHETNTPQEMVFRMNTLGAGRSVALTWLRDGEEHGGELLLMTAPDVPPREEMRITQEAALRGATLMRLNPAVVAEYDLPPDAAGVLVASVSDIAANVGLKAGDVLVAVNGIPVTRPAEVLDVLQQGGRRWALDVARQGNMVRLRFRL